MGQVKPAINQIEFHPYSLPTYTPTLLPLCKAHGIAIAGYGPLVPIVRHPGGPVDAVVDRVVAERGGKETVAQILALWAQQVSGGVVVTWASRGEMRSDAQDDGQVREDGRTDQSVFGEYRCAATFRRACGAHHCGRGFRTVS